MKLVLIKEAQESEWKNKQNKGNIEDADEEVDNKMKENMGEEEDIIWQSQDTEEEEERAELVPAPPPEDGSNMT